MDITLDKKNTTQASLKVKLKEADYQPKVDEKLKDYSKKAAIKGFRPGKVPASLIKKMYGKSIMVDEINQLITDSIQNYIKDNSLPIIGEPLPNPETNSIIDWDNQKEFEFEYKVGLHSEIKYDVSKKVKLNKYEIIIDKSVTQETIDNLQKQFGKIEHPEVSEQGDMIYGKLTGPDYEKEVLLPTKQVTGKEAKKFVGLKKDDKLEIEPAKLFDKGETSISSFMGVSKEEAEKIKGKYEFTVSAIQRTEPAEINQDFYDKIFGKDMVKTEEEFLAKVNETVSKNYERETEFLLNRDIQKTIVDDSKIELPDEFLKDYLFIINQGKISKEQIGKEYDLYAKDLRWGLIRNKLITDNEIKIENDDIVKEAKETIKERYMQMAGGAEMDQIIDSLVNNYLKHENGKYFKETYEKVLNDKVIGFIRDNVTIQEKKVSFEEFKKIALN